MELLVINMNNHGRVKCLLQKSRDYYRDKSNKDKVKEANTMLKTVDKVLVKEQKKELLIEMNNSFYEFFGPIEEITDNIKCLACKYHTRCTQTLR